MKYLIVGHGEFPSGMKSAISLLLGNEIVDSIDLVNDKTHAKFAQEVESYFQKNEEVLVFADLTGGAPHQITAQILKKSQLKQWFILSNITVSMVMEICLMIEMEKNPANYEKIIHQAIDATKNTIFLLKR